jgi:hypothetical protein
MFLRRRKLLTNLKKQPVLFPKDKMFLRRKEGPGLPEGTVAKEKFELVLKEDNVPETKDYPDPPEGTIAKEKFELVLKEDNVLQTKEDLAPQFCVSRRGEGVQYLMASERLNMKGFHL